MGITVITPSIPERRRLLAQAMESVQVQISPFDAHLIRVQQPPKDVLSLVHISSQLNALLSAVDTEWVAPLCDDDVYLPDHVEKIQPYLKPDADVVYSWARDEYDENRVDLSEVPPDKVAFLLGQRNFIRSTITIRTEVLRRIGGWAHEYREGKFGGTGAEFEDWDLLIRLARAGARFRCAPFETWIYRSGNWRRTLTWKGEDTPGFRVVSARYGIDGSFADVTNLVAHIATDEGVEFEVDNDAFGMDPAEDHVKEFRITYSVDGVVTERLFTEGDSVNLP
jgi:hypothetical protein